MNKRYDVVEHYKGERLGAIDTFDTREEAEKRINSLFATEGVFDYKTTFSIEEVED